jgi:hypothetical protein
MNFAKVGDKVKHSKHGSGTVSRLVGPNKDDGVVVNGKGGKTHKVNYGDDPAKSGWFKKKRSKTEEALQADRIVDILLERK